MIKYSYSIPVTEDEIGTIQVEKPILSLNDITDIHGQKWNIRALFGKMVQAVEIEKLHDCFSATGFESFTSSTGSSNLITQSWKPYHVEIIKKVHKK